MLSLNLILCERSESENTLVLQAGHQRSKGGVEDLVRQRQDVLFVDLVLLPFPSTAWPHLLYQVLSKSVQTKGPQRPLAVLPLNQPQNERLLNRLIGTRQG